MFPLSPCKHHVPIAESLLGASCHHHFLGNGHTCVMCKSLALLLLAHVDGKWKARINSLVEIGDVDVKIRLADLHICLMALCSLSMGHYIKIIIFT